MKKIIIVTFLMIAAGNVSEREMAEADKALCENWASGGQEYSTVCLQEYSEMKGEY